MDSDKVIEQRKKEFFNKLKKNSDYLSYLVLAVISFLTLRLRLSNTYGLRDVTTGAWTLGPDLDPFLFLRWAKDIVANGSLYAIDTLRYVPLGFETKGELLLHSYLLVWFHNVATIFGSESITQSAAIYPAYAYALTVIAFFFLAREIFVDNLGKNRSNIIALISSLFLSILPVILPRTIAGIPEKEASGFLFMFLAFFFILKAFKTEGKKKYLVYGLLSGTLTAIMGLVWGGVIFIFVTISLTSAITFFLGGLSRKRFYAYTAWFASSFIILALATPRYSFEVLFTSSTSALAAIFFFVYLIHFIIFQTKLKEKIYKGRARKIPPQVFSFIIATVLGILLVSIVFSPIFFANFLKDVGKSLVTPTTDRLGVTVAENRQPFFTEWATSFGPNVKNIPIYLWTFLLGSISLFYSLVGVLKKKERFYLTAAYTFFLFSLVFSRYDPNAFFNGTNAASVLFYSLGFLFLLGTASRYYYQYYRSGEQSIFKKIPINLIFVFSFFFLTIVATRGAVRLIMVMVPSSSIIVGYFLVSLFDLTKKQKDSTKRNLYGIALIVFVLASMYSALAFYQISSAQAAGYVPTPYTHQWQKAMSWVRDNTSQDAVFAHWWDYGYWVQSIGERATVLDGGNAIPYWNHLMGRYALTGYSEEEALEFFYAHNVTHFLIDSTDIGKYAAFSSIGSDESYDRISFVPTLQRNNQLTQETKNSILYVYQGGISTSEDIVYEQNGSRIFLPSGKTGLIAVLIEKGPSDEILTQPQAVFTYQNQQYTLPLRYAFDGTINDFSSGIDSGVFLYSSVSSDGSQLQPQGALLYLNQRTINSRLARYYLFEEESEYVKLVYSQDDESVAQIKSATGTDDDFIYLQGLRGPIKIWEISYPQDIEFKEEFLSKEYPEELRIAR